LAFEPASQRAYDGRRMNRPNQRPAKAGSQPPALSAGQPGLGDNGTVTKKGGLLDFLAPLWRRDWLVGLLLIAATVLAYQPVWHAGFIWDDDTFLVDNPVIKSADGPYRLWFTASTPDYFPMTSSMLWLEWRLWNGHPLGFHLVNVLLQAFSAVLLWRVLLRLKIPGAILAAGLFALHPVNVESVAWITERKNTLSMFFYLGALLAWLRFEDSGKGRWYGLALTGFALGLLSKTALVPLPVVMLGMAWWRRGRVKWNEVSRIVPFIVIAAALGLVTVWFQSHRTIGNEIIRTDGFWARLAGAGWAVWFYLYKAALPINLAFVYPRWQIDGRNPLSYIPLILLVVVLVSCWRRRQTWGKALFFGLGYFVVMLLPVLGFIDIYFMRYSLVSDHWQYFAIIAPIALAAAIIRKVPVLAAALLLALGALTWRQCGMYASQETLWPATLRLNPNCWMAQVNLGDVYLEQGKMDEGIRLLQQGLQLNPANVEGHLTLGLALLHQGKLDEAIAQAQKAHDLNPARGGPHFILGECYFRQNRFDEAVSQYQTALARKLQVGEAEAHYGLGSSLAHLGRTGEAVTEFEKSLQLRPDDAPTRLSLGDALLQEGKLDEAIAQFQKAAETKPDLPDAHVKLGGALAQQGRMDEAIAQLQKAVQLKPDLAPAQLNLGNALLQEGRVEEAIRHYEKALQISPGYGKAHSNLASALLRQGKMGDAITHLQRAVQLEPDDASLQNNLAWLLATGPDASLRNGEMAVSLARQANAQTGGENPAILHTLAAAYAQAGRFAEAVETARHALSLAGAQSNSALSAQLEYELSLYQAGSQLHAAGSTH